MTELTSLDSSYQQLLLGLKQRIQQAQVKAALESVMHFVVVE